MPTTRIPVTSSVDPETSGADINFGSKSKNIIYDRYPDGKIYATQRPSLRLSQDPSNFAGITSNGRGVYFWEVNDTFVIVNDSKVEFGYGLSIGNISSGKDPVYFVETPTHLVILDAESNRGYTIDAASPVAVVEITDADFPPKQGTPKQLAGGGAFLDGYLFVMDTEGFIWNSDINDPLSWNALNFLKAERETDVGTYLAKHHDNIVAVGSKSVEFFYDAGNPVGSPLSRRQDVSFRTGVVDRKSVFVTGDVIAFIGSDRKSTNGLYELKGFQLTKKSNFSIDRLFSDLGIQKDFDFILANAMIDDHFFTFITAVFDDGGPSWNVIKSIVFDSSTGLWSTFSVALNNIVEFPVISVADKLFGQERNIEMLLTDGNVFEVSGSLDPIDSDAAGPYFLEDYMVNNQDYVEDLGSSTFVTANIEASITLPEVDFNTNSNKFAHSVWVVGTTLNKSLKTTPIKLSWSDDHYETFSPTRDINLDARRKITRLGKFRRRGFKLDYSGPDTLRIEALELMAGVSQYA